MSARSITANDEGDEFEIPETLAPRLRRTNGWCKDFTRKAIEGYRQFMKLKIQQEDWNATILSPSLTIDTVWHSHILDTKHYGEACEEYAGQMVHHNPDGGLNQTERNERIKITKATLRGLCGKTFDEEVWSFDEEEEEESASGRSNKRRREEVNAGPNIIPANGASPNSRSGSGSAPITIVLRDQTGDRIFFKIKRSTRMKHVFAVYAQRKGIAVGSLRFFLDGDQIDDAQTPIMLELEDNDQIDVMLELGGC
jgi:hypothetical protein